MKFFKSLFSCFSVKNIIEEQPKIEKIENIQIHIEKKEHSISSLNTQDLRDIDDFVNSMIEKQNYLEDCVINTEYIIEMVFDDISFNEN